MRKNNQVTKRAELALSILNNKKNKTDDDKQRQTDETQNGIDEANEEIVPVAQVAAAAVHFPSFSNKKMSK